ncbi:hypothetical protein ACTXT7_000409, partial [Hymenolepis weldensis]
MKFAEVQILATTDAPFVPISVTSRRRCLGVMIGICFDICVQICAHTAGSPVDIVVEILLP